MAKRQKHYIERADTQCPHCGNADNPERTNKYLFRCVNYAECGRYW